MIQVVVATIRIAGYLSGGSCKHKPEMCNINVGALTYIHQKRTRLCNTQWYDNVDYAIAMTAPCLR